MAEPKPFIITLHWTAGTYDATFGDYHYNVKGDGRVVNTLPVSKKGAHCWKRNTGNIGVTMCAMGTVKGKKFPVTDKQREATAKLVAELCLVHGIDMDGEVEVPELKLIGGDLVPTGRKIKAPCVTDHAFFAHKDGYFPDRWDVGAEYEPIIRKARWYYQNLKEKKIRFEFVKA